MSSMLAKLVNFCKSFDSRLKSVEKSLAEVAEATSQLRNVLAEPSGFITTNAVVQEGLSELQRGLKHPVQVGLEEAKVNVQFAQAFYLTSSPQLKGKLHEFLSENELITLQRSIELFKEAESLTDESGRRLADAKAEYSEAKKNIEGAIERQASFTFSRVVDRMHKQLSDLERKADYVAVAEQEVKDALKKCESFMAKHGNTIKTSTPVNNKKIYSP